MAIVAIDAGLFCLGRQVADGVRERLCAAELTDEQLFAIASEIEGHPDNVAAALYGGITICSPPGAPYCV